VSAKSVTSLARYLARLGYGTRKEAEALLSARRVTQGDGRVLREGAAFTHNDVLVDGVPLDPPPGSVVLLHKPVGHVCSTQDRPPLVYELLPARFVRRDPVMATVGRLDADTSGLLLLTDDGVLNHTLTSPRTHLPKVYVARLDVLPADDQLKRLQDGGLMLRGETTPLAPAVVEPCGERVVRLTLTEGRYHQVRRMFAAVGAHVETLHREAFGPLQLGSMPAGQWRVLSEDEVTNLRESARRLPEAVAQ
jgi:16S rRNA pseudouridine516 synthase